MCCVFVLFMRVRVWVRVCVYKCVFRVNNECNIDFTQYTFRFVKPSYVRRTRNDMFMQQLKRRNKAYYLQRKNKKYHLIIEGSAITKFVRCELLKIKSSIMFEKKRMKKERNEFQCSWCLEGVVDLVIEIMFERAKLFCKKKLACTASFTCPSKARVNSS